MSKLINRIGQRFGKLTVLSRGEALYGAKNATWVCMCDCGRVRTVYAPSLSKGRTKSCGKGLCRYPKMPVKARFDKHTVADPHSDCLLWRGARSSNGYPQLRMSKDVLKTASHIALELDGRPVPAGMYVLHRCDNPGCVNADHLFVGTQKDNVRDMMNKGRHNFSGLPKGRPLGTIAAKAAARAKREAA